MFVWIFHRVSGLLLIVLFAGVDGAGKGSMVNVLNNWMDPHYILTRPLGDPSPEEAERPRYWRFWRALPPRGEISILFGGWYQDAFENRFCGDWNDEQFNNELKRIADTERMLTRDGMLLSLPRCGGMPTRILAKRAFRDISILP